MLREHETHLPRRLRRAIVARRRTAINKGEPFGRVAVLSYDEGPGEQFAAALGAPHLARPRIVYCHMTRGIVDRVASDTLLWSIIT